MIKHPLFLAGTLLTLAACVDTSGLSADLTASAHPQSNANAAVTVVEFGDLQCPACKAAKELVMDQLLADKGQDFRFEFKHFPLSAIHRYAVEAAEASECAGDQGKFWPYIDQAYENQAELSPEAMDEWARTLNLDMELFGRCKDSHVKRDAILEQYEDGRSVQVRGTPTFFVNGQQTAATVEALTQAIDNALESQVNLL